MTVKQQGRGLLIKDEEGEVYFLRPEILEACKVSPEEFRLGAAIRLPEVGAGILGTLRIDKELDVDLARQLKAKAHSTVMCPW